MTMRTLLALCLLTSIAAATPAASKAANARGMSLMSKKKWALAEAEFKNAVSEDDTSVKAHYNLASAASRAHDRGTAIWELEWVLDRAAWVSEAKTAAGKVENDDDLEWALKNWDERVLQWVDKDAKTAPLDVVVSPDGTRNGRATGGGKNLAAATGAHDSKCDPGNAKQGKVFTLALNYGNLDKLTALASLRDGVALADSSGGIVARSEPLGCTGPGESQDQLATLSNVDGSPLIGDIEDKHVASTGLQLLVVSYTAGGRREWQTNVAVFARKDKVLVKVFENTLASSDATGVGHLTQSPLGNLIYCGPGETTKHAFRWDPTAFKFVPLP